MTKKSYLGVTILVTIIVIGVLFLFFNNSSTNLRDRLSETTAKAVVLSCMDFRFVNDTVYFLNKQYKDNYNKLSLAGASLGYNQDTFKEWGITIDKHIELAKQLHDVNEIIVIDHMDCGAYRILYDNEQMSKEEEYDLHRKNLNKFRTIMNKKFPELKVTTLLVNIDGSIVPI
jgi:carbonic anhydrase